MSESEIETIWLDLPASHKYLNVLTACLEATLERVLEPASQPAVIAQQDGAGGLPDSARLCGDIALAAHEVCVNIIDHAYADQSGGRIQIRLILEQVVRRLVIEICDVGQSFDPALVPEPDFEQGQIHGYGLFLVHQLMDEVAYESQPGRNFWRLVKSY
jgi:serine/threonine-protein kinase RsbW